MGVSHREQQAKEQPAPRTLEEARTGRKRRPEPTRHTWTRSSVVLVGRKKKTGLNQLQNHPFDLRPFGASPSSLLVRVLRRIPFGEHSGYLMALSAVLKGLKDNPEAKAILRAPPSELNTWDIRELFIAIEDELASRSESSHYGRSIAVRSLFARYDGKLNDGTRIADLQFPSRFPSDTTTRTYNKVKKAAAKTVPPKLLHDFDSLQERNAKALSDAVAEQEAIFAACEKIIAEHEQAKQLVITARDAGLPSLSKRTRNAVLRGGRPDRSIIHRMTPEDRLRLIIYMVDRVEFGKPLRSIPFLSLEQFDLLLDSRSGPRRFEPILSDRFLPRLVVVAHALTILTITGLNPDVIYTLTRSNITRQGKYTIITGYKGRTDANVEAHLNNEEAANSSSDEIKVSHDRAIKAINELVANAEKIEAAFNLKSVPLICGLEYTTNSPSFYVFAFYQEARRFWKWNNVPHIELRSLRPLAARVEYLSPRWLFVFGTGSAHSQGQDNNR